MWATTTGTASTDFGCSNLLLHLSSKQQAGVCVNPSCLFLQDSRVHSNLTSLISSYRWLPAWSICEDKHLQQGTSTVLLRSSLYRCAARSTQCIWSVKWKMTRRMELGANTYVHLEAKWPWMLNHTEVSRSLCNLLFSRIGKRKSTPISPSWCLYAGLSFSTTNGEENKKWNLQENRINLFAGVS